MTGGWGRCIRHLFFLLNLRSNLDSSLAQSGKDSTRLDRKFLTIKELGSGGGSENISFGLFAKAYFVARTDIRNKILYYLGIIGHEMHCASAKARARHAGTPLE